VREKVQLVDAVREEYSVNAALRVLSLPRSTYCYHRGTDRSYEAKYGHLHERLEAVAREHPDYGYRRVTTELNEVPGVHVNRKVVQKLHRLWDLPVIRKVRSPRPGAVREVILTAGDRANLVRSLDEIGAFEVVHTDFTDLPFGGGVAQFIPILDHHAKVVLGWQVDSQRTAEVARRAWQHAKTMLRRLHLDQGGMIMHHDQGSAFISYDWARQILLRDRMKLSFALGGAGDNAEMESFFGRFKTENMSLFLDAKTIAELVEVVRERIRYYNWKRRHSSLGNQAPMRYAKRLLKEKPSQ
jgi:putative transposase